MNGLKERILALGVFVTIGQSFGCGGAVSGDVGSDEVTFLDVDAADARVESASGTTIPPARRIVDSRRVVWSLRDGLSYQNGVADTGSNIAWLLYYEGHVYALNNSNEWWAWTDGWYQIGGDPRESVNPPDPTPDPAPQTNNPLLGGCGNCDGVDALRGFESYINRPVDYVLVWGWAQTAGDLMYAFHYLDEMWPASYKLHYSVPMVLMHGTFAEVYNGSLDAVYRDVAQTIANRDPNGIIRLGHEMNGNWYDWSQDGPAGSSAEFTWAYQRIVTVFRSVSPDFEFVWNPGAGKWAGIDSISTYPGDAYVDYMSFDMYEDAGWAVHSPAERWNHFLDNDGRGLDWLAQFAGQHGKAMAFDEWGSAIDDGVFITNMHAWMSTHNVAYQMYWNSNAAFTGSFDSNPVNGATYQRLFGR